MRSVYVAALSLGGLTGHVVRADTAVASAWMYDSGAVMDDLMARKEATWDLLTKQGLMDASIYPTFARADGPVACENGVAAVVPGNVNQTFRCNNMDFYDFVSHADLGSTTGRGSSIWGWTSEDGRELVSVAQADGTAFAEVSKEGKLIYLGRLPQFSQPSMWREIKGYKSFIVIGSEATNHGVQIFDMKKLLTQNAASPKVFSNQEDLTGHFSGLPQGRTHNIVVNEEKNYAVAVGAMPRNASCASGLIFIDLTDPSKPTSPGCSGADGYVHDAQCLVYRGPDEKYNGRDICYGYNEDTLTIYDVSNKSSPVVISRTGYTGAAYTHQGWVTDPAWQEFLVADDEYDEVNRTAPGDATKATTYFWDIRSLENPKQTGAFQSPVTSIDHNQYIADGLSFQSNYGAGLRVINVTSLKEDPTGRAVREVAHFDIYPEDDARPGGGAVSFTGTWANYPYFKSGFVVINTMERGAFVVKMTNRNALK